MAGATLKQVASRAGVSYQTVSNVLNSHPSIRPATRERVLQAIRELDYQPNFAAKSLRASRSMTLACAFLEHPSDEFSDPYRSLIQSAVAHEANERGYSTLSAFLFHQKPITFQNLRQQYQQKRFDAALIVAASPEAASIEEIKSWRMPCVLYDYASQEAGLPSVTAQYADGMRQLVDHLVQQGRRRLALVIPADYGVSTLERRQGFLDATRQHGVQGTLHSGDWTFASGEAAFHQLWKRGRKPDAVLAANDRMAAGCLTAARQLGVKVPHDVLVTGFDDFEFARYTAPGLTTVRVPYADMASRAVRELIRALDGPPGAPEAAPTTLRLPVTLVKRESA